MFNSNKNECLRLSTNTSQMDGIRVSRVSESPVEYRVLYYTCHISKLDENIKLLNWEVSSSLNSMKKGQLVGGINICAVGEMTAQVIISQAMVYPKE